MAHSTQGWPFERVNAAGTKHEMTRIQLQEFIADQLDLKTRDTAAQLVGRSGIFPTTGAGTGMTVAAGGANDTITISDGVGLLFNATDIFFPIVDWSSPGNIEVENQGGTTYHVGLRLSQVPIPTNDGIRQNARTIGQIQYLAHRMEVGVLGHPDNVGDGGAGLLDIEVSSLVQIGGAAVNQGDRTMRVWMASPVSAVAATAFQTSTQDGVAGSYEFVSIPDMGQTDAGITKSLDPLDYWCLVTGPSVTTRDITADDDYLYLGSFSGAGPGAPIGAVSTVGVYRFAATFGTLDADVTTLYEDLYTAPSRDGDGLPNLATPIQTTLDGHLDGGVSKHDATEVDDETVGGYHGVNVQLTLDAVEAEVSARQRIYPYSTTEALLQSGDRFGLVAPDGGNILSEARYGWAWQIVGDADEEHICSDGEYLWTMAGAATNHFVRRRLRSTGAVDADGAQTYDYTFIATAGFNVFALDDSAGTVVLKAVNRSTLVESHTVNVVAGTARALATDGRYVAVAVDNVLYLYRDTGAAWAAVGTYDHTAQINDVWMDGTWIVIGGVTPGGGPPHDQIRVLDYTPAVNTSISRTGNPAVRHVAFDSRNIGFVGDTDGGNFTGLVTAFGTIRWEGVTDASDALFVHGELVTAEDGTIAFYDPVDGALMKAVLWDAGAATPLRGLAWDNDALFVLGDVTAATHRLGRLTIRNQSELFETAQSDSTRNDRAVPSAVWPLSGRVVP